MIGKLLLALLVITLIIVYWRKRQQSVSKRSTSRDAGSKTGSGMPARTSDSGELEQFLQRARSSTRPATPDLDTPTSALAPRIKAILWTVLIILGLAAAVGSYLHWQDQQRMVTVLLHRNASDAPVIYRVAKRDLGVNHFVTDDGTQVTVSANERMEVVGL